ncbi:serine/threonine-protein phosphatase 6 regulatory ankyrin repeat subunit B-like [Coccinella septempunctata]|uniref:serine/threonine-protein phosphatase 6 regulatory ankyrin repeat subunit B-like n=1 Tax=Coccinella septempunctata TaxID=41139 RepID=UPI001D067C62|nr:serine/threonine-protein phosphatase 6 regulatory ankyrin repeat subunit B-like [Coccinella septempunctata]
MCNFNWQVFPLDVLLRREQNVDVMSDLIESYLEENDTDINYKYEGYTFLHYSCATGRQELTYRIIHRYSRIIDIDATTPLGETALHLAINKGDQLIVDILLGAGANPNAPRNVDGKTALHLSICKDSSGILRSLLNMPTINVNAEDNKKCTALHDAVRIEQCLKVKLLLKAGANPNPRKSRISPLHLVMKHKYDSITNILIRKGADIDALDFNKYTPLHSAVLAENETIVRALLDNGASPNFNPNQRRKSVIHLAVERNNIRIFAMILERTEMIDVPDMDGLSPLQKAVLAENEEKVRLLLARRASPIIQHKNKMLLQHAVEKGNFNITKLLLENMPVPEATNFKSEGGVTPLESAVRSERGDIVDLLVANGADVNIQNADGNSPLHIACQKGSLDMVTRLLTCPNVDFDARNKAGYTPLNLAFDSKNLMKVDRLILSGADPNIPNPKTGQTPLHEAVSLGSLDTLYMLLQRDNIDIEAKNSHGETPLKYAVDLKANEAVAMLINQGADVNILCYLGKNLLHIVSEEGNLALVDILLGTKKIPIDAPDDYGNTPLGYAVQNSDADLARLLLINSADPNVASNKIKPISIAVFNQQTSIVKLLLNTGRIKFDAASTILFTATAKNRGDMIDLLLEYNEKLPKGERIDINSRNEEQDQTVLHVAVKLKFSECVRILLKYRANANIRDYDNKTPLHLSPDATITKLLIESGAQINVKDIKFRTPLHHAVKTRDVQSVYLLLQHGANVASSSENGRTPLILAAKVNETTTKEDKKEMLAILEALLKANHSSINSPDCKGATPLYYAVKGDFPEAVKALLEHGADSAKIFEDKTLLHIAAEKQSSDVLKELLKFQPLPNINSLDNNQRTPLMISIEKQDFKSVRELLHYAPDVNLQGNGDTALTLALKNKSIPIILLLLGVPTLNVNIADATTRTPLHLAVIQNSTTLVKRLIELGADPNAKEAQFGRTPLHTAAHKERIELIEFFVSVKNIFLDAPDKDGLTPLHLACRGISQELVETVIDTLIKNGADVDLPCNAGNTVVHYVAARQDLTSQLELIIRNDRRRLNTKNNIGETPLHLACRNLDNKSIKFLLKEGASLEVTNIYGRTPPDLYIQSLYQDDDRLSTRMVPPTMKEAAMSAMEVLIDTQQYNAFETMIELNKNVQWFDVEYLSCLLYFSIRKHKRFEMVQALLESGADINFRMAFSNDDRPDTILSVAVDQLAVLELLLADENCEVNFPGEYSRTALHVAVQKNLAHETVLLLERGANPNALDSYNNNPLCYTVNRDLIITLLKYGADPFINPSVMRNCLNISPYHLISRAVIKNFMSNDDKDLNLLKAYFNGHAYAQQIINSCVENISDCTLSIDSLIDDKLSEEVTYADILLECYPEVHEGNIERIKEIMQMDYHRQVIAWCLDFVRTKLIVIEKALPIMKPIGNSSVTLKSFLTADRDQISRYLQSREVIRFLIATNLTVYTPRYSQELNQLIELGNEVFILRNEICSCIIRPDIRESTYLGRLPIECIEFILEMLRWVDLLNLKEALSSVSEID